MVTRTLVKVEHVHDSVTHYVRPFRLLPLHYNHHQIKGSIKLFSLYETKFTFKRFKENICSSSSTDTTYNVAKD